MPARRRRRPLLRRRRRSSPRGGAAGVRRGVRCGRDGDAGACVRGTPYARRAGGPGVALPDGAHALRAAAHHCAGRAEQLPVGDVRAALGPAAGGSACRRAGTTSRRCWLLLARDGHHAGGRAGRRRAAQYLLNPSRREHALADLAPRAAAARSCRRCPPRRWRKKGRALRPRPGGAGRGATARGGRGAAAGARCSGRRWTAGAGKLARELELPLVPVLARMERRREGGPGRARDASRRKVDAECAAQLKEIHQLAGHEFNVGSNPQLAQVLYDELKLPVLKRGKTGPSTDQEVLEKLAEQHPLPRAIIEYRDARQAQEHLPGHAADAGGEGRAASTPPSTRRPRRPAGCPRRIPTCRTSPSAPSWAGRSAGPSSPRRATSWSPRTTARSSCGCWRTSPRTRR